MRSFAVLLLLDAALGSSVCRSARPASPLGSSARSTLICSRRHAVASAAALLNVPFARAEEVEEVDYNKRTRTMKTQEGLIPGDYFNIYGVVPPL